MSRVIRKSQTRSSTEAASLLANLFAAELVSPSECIWLVSPWISDIQILDNEAAPLTRSTGGGRASYGSLSARHPGLLWLIGRNRNDG